MKRSSVPRCSFWAPVLTLLYGALAAVAAPTTYTFTKPSSGYLLAKEYPRTSLRVEFQLRCDTPGTVLDTVGLNSAGAGAWAVTVWPDRKLKAQVFDGGWRVLTSTQALAAGQTYRVILEFDGQTMVLRVADAAPLSLPLKTPLSGQPLWAGDHPGDDGWGAGHNIHPAFRGTLTLVGIGPISAPAPVTPPTTPTATTPAPDTPSALPPAAVLARQTIGPAGGAVVAPGVARVTFPAGALVANEEVVIHSTPSDVGHFIALQRGGSGRLAKPVKVAIPLPAGVDPGQVMAFHQVAPGLVMGVPSTVDKASRTLTMEVRHFSVLGWLENVGARTWGRIVGASAGSLAGGGTVVGIFGKAAVSTLGGMTASMWMIVGGGALVGYTLADPAYDAWYKAGMSGPVGRPGPFSVLWQESAFAARPRVWEVADKKTGRVLGHFSPLDLPADPLQVQKTQPTQPVALPGVPAAVTWADVTLGQIPADILTVWARLQYTRAWYAKQGYTVPPAPMTVIVRTMKSSGEFDGRFLFLSPRAFVEGGEFVDELDSAIAHEYFHAVHKQHGWSDGAFVGKEESLCVAHESLVFPACDAFLTKDSVWGNVYPRLANGLLSEGDGEDNTTPGRRGYLLWPWPKFLHHRYNAQAVREYAAKTVSKGVLSERFRAFAYSLLASDQALLDPIQVMNLEQRREASRTGWREFSLVAMAQPNGRLRLGQSKLAPSAPLSMRALLATVPRTVTGPLVVRRAKPDPAEEFVALKPRTGSGSLAASWQRSEMVGLPGGGIIREPWISGPGYSEVMGLAVIGTGTEQPAAPGDDSLLLYRLNPPSELSLAPGAAGKTRLRWKQPDLGAPVKLADAISCYRLLGRTAQGKEELVGEIYFDVSPESLFKLPGKLMLSIASSASEVELPADIAGKYEALGLQSVDKVLREGNATVVSEAAWTGSGFDHKYLHLIMLVNVPCTYNARYVNHPEMDKKDVIEKVALQRGESDMTLKIDSDRFGCTYLVGTGTVTVAGKLDARHTMVEEVTITYDFRRTFPNGVEARRWSLTAKGIPLRYKWDSKRVDFEMDDDLGPRPPGFAFTRIDYLGVDQKGPLAGGGFADSERWEKPQLAKAAGSISLTFRQTPRREPAKPNTEPR